MKLITDNQFSLGPDSKEWFLKSDKMPALQKLGVSMAGSTEVVDEYICARISPLQSRLLISVDGSATLNTHKDQFDILPEQVVLLPKGQDFSYQSDGRWQFVWFIFEHDFSSELMPNHISIEAFKEALELKHISVLLNICDQPPLLNQLGLRLHQLLLSALEPLTDKTSSSSQLSQNKLHRLFKNIEQQLHLTWSVDELASNLFCSKATLHRLCAQEYQCSPMHKITELRMRRACELLKQTDWSIKQISQQVGFKDPLNFSHRFKQWHNHSPKHYRDHS